MREPDAVKRDQLMKQAYEIVLRDFACITIQQQPLLTGVSRKVEMVQRPDNHFHVFWKKA